MLKQQLYKPTGLSYVGKINRKKLALRLGGLLLLLFFLWKLNLNLGQIAKTLWEANEWLVLPSVLLIFPIVGLKAWRWRLIMTDLGIKISSKEAFRLYGLGLATGSFTPGQLGDAIKAFYLRDKGFSLGSGLLSVVLDRLFDLAALGLLASVGLFFLGSAFLGALPVMLVMLAGFGLALLSLSFPATRRKLLAFITRLILHKNRKFEADAPIQSGIEIRSARLSLPFLITLVTAGLASGRIWLLALAIGLNLGFSEALASSTLATAASLLPVSIAGVGTRDLTLVTILGQLGYAAELAISLSTLILLLNLVNLVAGYLIWFFTRPETPGEIEK